MLDIVFCSVPYSDLDHIYSAPAILKGVVQNHGYSAKTVEFGCTLFELCHKDLAKFHQIQKYFISNTDATPEQSEVIAEFYDTVIDFFRTHPSKYIGISAISYYSHRAIYEICQRIRAANIPSKIVLGGRGAATPVWKVLQSRWTLAKQYQWSTFADFLTRQQLIDIHVQGDGEDAILDVLSAQKTDNFAASSDQFRSPVPDYSDYNFDLYWFDRQNISWPITGSKGCVRDCDFCDVKKLFGRYRYRSGKDIADEMIAVSLQTGARKFMFTDSLVNGGLKPFREFLEVMTAYNQAHPDRAIKWNGQYICRPDTPESIYPLIATAGGEGLTIGAESGSNKVLEAMNKKTTVQALFRELELFQKHGITTVLLLMPGHWSETWEDFVAHCKMLVDIVPFVRAGTVSAVQTGQPMSIIPETPSWHAAADNNVILSNFDPAKIWFCKDNPTNTFKERVYRQILSVRLAQKLRIPIVNEYPNYLATLTSLETYHDHIQNFYQQFF